MAWVLLAACVIVAVFAGAAAWTVAAGGLGEMPDLERERDIARICIGLAQLLAIGLTVWLVGHRLTASTGWRWSASVATAAAIATILVRIYVPWARRWSAPDRIRTAGRGRFGFHVWLVVGSVTPFALAGFGSASSTRVTVWLVWALTGATALLAVWLLSAPILVALLTEPCPHDAEAVVLEACRLHGQRVRAVRVLRLAGRPYAHAGVVGVLPRWRYILLSEAIIRTLPRAEFEAVAFREVGHLLNSNPAQRVQMQVLAALVYCGYLAFMPGPLALSVPIGWAILGLYRRRATLTRELVADQFAARICGVPVVIAALLRIAEFNGVRTLGPSESTVGGSGNSHLNARLERLRAIKSPIQDAG